MEHNSKKHSNELYKAILKLETVEECEKFFEDLCTHTEINAMEQRFLVASLLMKDRIYMDILKETGASTATISRVKRMLNDGTGCLPEIIIKMG